MIIYVFIDLSYFLAFYGFVIIFIGNLFAQLFIEIEDNGTDYYEGISYFGYYIMAFRASTGDF